MLIKISKERKLRGNRGMTCKSCGLQYHWAYLIMTTWLCRVICSMNRKSLCGTTTCCKSFWNVIGEFSCLPHCFVPCGLTQSYTCTHDFMSPYTLFTRPHYIKRFLVINIPQFVSRHKIKISLHVGKLNKFCVILKIL